jgi:enolase-phosphatase E1
LRTPDGASPIKAVVTDIEGTTAPISFVAETLFPFAARRLDDFIAKNRANPDIAALLDETRTLEGAANASESETAAILQSWIAADKKLAPLKSLQGMIWRDGYETGQIVSPVYADAKDEMLAWKQAGLTQAVYSSGSAEAQILLYRYSVWGDLTGLFSDFFDTRNAGPKLEAVSYRKIAAALGLAPEEILFLSDNPKETDAARAAEMAAVRIDRTLNPGDQQTDPDGTLVAGGFAPVTRRFGLV